MTRLLPLIPAILLMLSSCTPSEPASHNVPNAAMQPASDNANAPAPSQPKSSSIPQEKLTQMAADGLVHSAIYPLPYQPTVTEPSKAQILYLMRAARFREAAHYAQNAPQSQQMRFIAAKSRILANLCSQQEPCTPQMDEIKTTQSDLIPVIEFWRIRAQIADLEFDKALKSISSFLTSTKLTQKSRKLTLEWIKTASNHGIFTSPNSDGEDNINETSRSTLQSLQKLIPRVTSGANAFESASLLHAQMQIDQSLGNAKGAKQKRLQLIQHYPATQMALWPELADSTDEISRLLSPNERFSRCQKLISHFDYDNARKELKAIVDDKSIPQQLRDKAEWELARVSMTNSEEPELSEKIYRKWANKNTSQKEEAVFGISRALSRQLKYREAIKALQNYDKQYPRGKYASRSLYLRGWYWFDLRENDKARPLLLQYAKKTNDTSVWGFYAQTFIRDGQWKEAIQAYEELKSNQNPIVRGKALYWQAYAEYQRGNHETAQKRLNEIHHEFPLTWYDILAYHREEDWFGKDAQKAIADLFAWQSDPRTDTIFYPWGYGAQLRQEPSSDTWKRIKTLTDYDAIEEARSLYSANDKALIASVSAENRDEFRRYATHLVEAYHDAWNDNSGSVRAMSKIKPSRANPKHKMAYPQPFAPLVESLAQDYGLPPYFIYGIMLQESRFRPWQVSSADAIGALQMIPKTARPIAKALGLEFHPDTFFDPRVGFPYSAYYMKMHYDKWGGNLAFTAGSYNGGPHRIGPWALRDKGKTLDWIVEEFSFDESRHYARKVSEHTLRFTYLYAHNPEEWIDVVNHIFPKVVPEIEPTDDWGL